MKFIIIIAFLMSACSVLKKNSVKRDNYGMNYRSKSLSDPMYNPIRKKVALLTLFNESPYGGEDLSIFATEELRKELGKSRDFIVDPMATQIFGSGKEVYAGGGVKLVQMTKKAKSAGVNLVMYGRITKARVRQNTDEIGVMRNQRSYAETEIELRVFDVNAGKEVLVDTQDGNVDDKTFRFYLDENNSNEDYRKNLLRYSVQVGMRKFVPKLIDLGEKLEWVGRVAKIIGTKIYVNAGRSSGINIGDILKVATEGQEIFDPETGSMIGYSQGDVKGTLEIIDYFGADGSVSILHSGGSVTEGDFVELY
jgi:hypothetical protein